jgi:hypothetical protein
MTPLDADEGHDYRTAARLLTALRAAGCRIAIDSDGVLLISPPLRRLAWDLDDVERDIEAHVDELCALVLHGETVQ